MKATIVEFIECTVGAANDGVYCKDGGTANTESTCQSGTSANGKQCNDGSSIAGAVCNDGTGAS